VLRKLEEKNLVNHRTEGRTFLYRAVETKRGLAARAVHHVIERFCNGSVEELLVGMVDNQVIAPKQLRKLAEKIAARKEKKS
jgi:predicted transcriptional regulator